MPRQRLGKKQLEVLEHLRCDHHLLYRRGSNTARFLNAQGDRVTWLVVTLSSNSIKSLFDQGYVAPTPGGRVGEAHITEAGLAALKRP